MIMATKNKPVKKYKDLDFQVEELPGCCGVGIVYYFEEKRGAYNWQSGRYSRVTGKHATLEAQAEACYKEILERTWQEGTFGNNYSYLQIALVSNYVNGDKVGSAQLPELQEKLLEKGWTINMVFINPNHGNEVTVYSKYFPERNTLPKDDFEELHDEIF
jgi:hypothetical protein